MTSHDCSPFALGCGLFARPCEVFSSPTPAFSHFLPAALVAATHFLLLSFRCFLRFRSPFPPRFLWRRSRASGTMPGGTNNGLTGGTPVMDDPRCQSFFQQPTCPTWRRLDDLHGTPCWTMTLGKPDLRIGSQVRLTAPTAKPAFRDWPLPVEPGTARNAGRRAGHRARISNSSSTGGCQPRLRKSGRPVRKNPTFSTGQDYISAIIQIAVAQGTWAICSRRARPVRQRKDEPSVKGAPSL
jgi:hypothetical protein